MRFLIYRPASFDPSPFSVTFLPFLLQIMRVWETMWCDHRTSHFNLFLACAMMVTLLSMKPPSCSELGQVGQMFQLSWSAINFFFFFFFFFFFLFSSFSPSTCRSPSMYLFIYIFISGNVIISIQLPIASNVIGDSRCPMYDSQFPSSYWYLWNQSLHILPVPLI